ncbi:NCS2 family permease [Asaia krungthepensis]|uniref:Xanthine/uracil/vitamin C transporter n=1 Tax=Asaia krungthepensis NRIC 0535 TaxID=1307925 RepID=A0ABQ0PW55_9PROT|nr:NCS2 family permease [Asaia krungthepensis]GBQ83106.1 xanthine/uracil/vitamin C transporter [Asaia krungthepensis NRIC 0535]
MSSSPIASWLDRRFTIGQRGSTVQREILAGLTTFGAMAYIMAVNPKIMASAGLATHDMIMTTIAAAICGTLLMALFANMPIALAPAMSSNAIFAQIVVRQMHVDVRTAFTIVLLGGVAFTALSVTKLRHKIIQAFPEPIVLGIQVAIGIFIARIGMVTGNLAVTTPNGFQFGSLSDPSVQLTLFGIFLAGALMALRVPAGMLITILTVTVVSLFVHKDGHALASLPQQPVELPSYPTHLLFPFNFADFFSHLELLLPITLYFLISDFFDATGTMYSVANRARLTKPDGTTLLGRAAFAADGSASIIGASLGTSTVSAYVESLVGVEAGGRTGLTALVVALLFAASSFLWPLIVMIPSEATAPVLILVGLSMLSALGQAANHSQEALLTPAFMLLIAVLTGNFMISLALGLLFYSLLLLVTRQFVRLTPMVLGLDAVFLFYLVLVARTGLGQG